MGNRRAGLIVGVLPANVPTISNYPNNRTRTVKMRRTPLNAGCCMRAPRP